MYGSPGFRWCLKHDSLSSVCGCPLLPRSGSAGYPQGIPRNLFRARCWLTRVVILQAIFFLLLFFAGLQSVFADQFWSARVLNGATLQGRCEVAEGDVMACLSSVLAQLNRAKGLADGTTSYRYVSRSADTLDATVGNSVTAVVDEPDGGANATWTIITDRVGAPVLEAGFMIFLVGMVLAFGHGWLAGGQR